MRHLGSAAVLLVLAATAAADAPPELRAVGVVAGRARGQALLRCAGRTESAAVGERACGVRVDAINATAVSVTGPDGSRDLPLQPGPAVERAAPGVLSLSRAELEARLAREGGRIVAETTLSPYRLPDGRPGVILARIPEGTVLEILGLAPGDVLLDVDGEAIDGTAALHDLLPKVRGRDHARVRVVRDGAERVLDIRIR